MRDTELYQQVLGLREPWSVERVDLNVAGRRVDVWVEHAASVSWPCPQCHQLLAGYDHAEERVWRHLDTCQFETHLHARIPRVNCAEHGVVNVAVPWAEARSRFTARIAHTRGHEAYALMCEGVRREQIRYSSLVERPRHSHNQLQRSALRYIAII